ncbi:MAG: DNA repair protein RecO [Oscillospiraceae bacterium]|nr:DNA repair protein RecO [Oscillospiraceae bacterium]
MDGLVLRERPVRDKGRFIDIMTQEKGVIEVYVNGAKKASGKSTCATQLFSYANFYVEQRGDMYYYKNAKPIRIFYELRENLENLSLASYFSDLIRYTVHKGRQNNMVLRLILNTLHFLIEGKHNSKALKALFELRLATELGFMPDVLVCSRCMGYLPESLVYSVEEGRYWCEECFPGDIGPLDFKMRLSGLEMIRHVTLMDFARLYSFRVSDETLDAVSRFAEAFICHHISMRPSTLNFYHNLKGGM